MRIWAHRGCSQRYPENTITSFTKSAELFPEGLVGIELDVQLTKDREMVVIHDERVDRTTEGTGFVRDFTFEEIRTLKIETGGLNKERIPTLKEVLDILEEPLRNGFMLNIELKNSIYPYPGMEELVLREIKERGLEKNVVFSTFYARSIEVLKHLGTESELAILDTRASDCLYKLKGGCGAASLHPYAGAIDLEADSLKGYNVRAWFTGHLYPEKPTGGRLDISTLESRGITDIFINEPEVYLQNGNLS